MGNTWKGCSDEKMLAAEMKLLQTAGIECEDIIQEDVNLDGRRGSSNYIHQVTVKPKEQGRPKLVMIHGFGGGGAVFFKMIHYLSNYFEVIAVDLLGQGASGRPDYKQMDYEATVDFFIDSLHAWAEKVMLTASGEYYLLGHSFGGYIAAEYALRHPEKISKVILMSPIGVNIPP